MSLNSSNISEAANLTSESHSPSAADYLALTVIFSTECGVSLAFIVYMTVRMVQRQSVGEGATEPLSTFRLILMKLRGFSRAQTYIFDKLIGDVIFTITWGLMLLLGYVIPDDRQEPTIGILDLINSSALAHSVVNHVFMAWQHYRITIEPIASRTHPGFTRCFSRSTALTDVTVLWATAIVMGVYYEVQFYFLQIRGGSNYNYLCAGIASFLYFLLPLVAISSVSLAMVRNTRGEWKPSGSASAGSLQTISSTSSMEIYQRSHVRRQNATARLARLTWLFLLCWTPYHICTFALPSSKAVRSPISPTQVDFWVGKMATAVAYSYFALYPIVINFEKSFSFRIRLEWLISRFRSYPVLDI